MKDFFKRNVSLFLFFLILFSDTILSSNFLFSLSVKSEIGKIRRTSLLEDRGDPLRSKKRFNDSEKVEKISAHSDEKIGSDEGLYFFIAIILFWPFVLLALTVIFFTLGSSLFSVGSAGHLVFFIFGSLLLWALFILIVSYCDKVIKSFSKINLITIFLYGMLATVFFLIFTFAFPSYLFLFIFSMIIYAYTGAIALFMICILIFLLIKDFPGMKANFKSTYEEEMERLSRNRDSRQLGVISTIFKSKVFLAVSFLLLLLAASLVLMQQFLFPAVEVLSITSYVFFALSALFLILFVVKLSQSNWALLKRSLRPDFGQGNAFSFLILFFLGLTLTLTGTLLYLFVESVGLPLLIISTVPGGVFSLLNLFKFIQKFRNKPAGEEYNKTTALAFLSFLLANSFFILYLLSYGSSTTVLFPMLFFVAMAFLLFNMRIVQLFRDYRRISSLSETSSGVHEYPPDALSSRFRLAWSIGMNFFFIGLLFLGVSFVFSLVFQAPILLMLSIFYTVFVLQIVFVYFLLQRQGSSSPGVFSAIRSWFKLLRDKRKSKFKRSSVEEDSSDEDLLFESNFSLYFSKEQLESIDSLLGINFKKSWDYMIVNFVIERHFDRVDLGKEKRSIPLRILNRIASDRIFYLSFSHMASELSKIFEDPENLKRNEKRIDSKILSILKDFYTFSQNFDCLESNYTKKSFDDNKFQQFYAIDVEEYSGFLEQIEDSEPDFIKKINEDFVNLQKTFKSA